MVQVLRFSLLAVSVGVLPCPVLRAWMTDPRSGFFFSAVRRCPRVVAAAARRCGSGFRTADIHYFNRRILSGVTRRSRERSGWEVCLDRAFSQSSLLLLGRFTTCVLTTCMSTRFTGGFPPVSTRFTGELFSGFYPFHRGKLPKIHGSVDKLLALQGLQKTMFGTSAVDEVSSLTPAALPER